MNKDLTNKKFDLYRTYIFLLYNGIHKKTLKNYTSSKLYRGAELSKNEYQSIKNYLKIKNENKNGNSAVLYYLKNFASFSKDEKTPGFRSLNGKNCPCFNVGLLPPES